MLWTLVWEVKSNKSFKIHQKWCNIVAKMIQNRGLEGLWAALGANLGVLVVAWGVFGVSWCVLGCLLGVFWASWGRLGPSYARLDGADTWFQYGRASAASGASRRFCDSNVFQKASAKRVLHVFGGLGGLPNDVKNTTKDLLLHALPVLC